MTHSSSSYLWESGVVERDDLPLGVDVDGVEECGRGAIVVIAEEGGVPLPLGGVCHDRRRHVGQLRKERNHFKLGGQWTQKGIGGKVL